jgi:hypothetical protein
LIFQEELPDLLSHLSFQGSWWASHRSWSAPFQMEWSLK